MANLKAPRVGCEESRNRHYDRADMRRRRLLIVATVMGVAITAGFAIMELVFSQSRTYVGWVDLGTAAVLATVPLLYRFGELVPSLTYVTVVYLTVAVLCWHLGTGTGVQFYLLITGAAAVMIVGIERIGLAIAAAAIGVAIIVALQFTVPYDTGAEASWFITAGFVVNAIAAGV